MCELAKILREAAGERLTKKQPRCADLFRGAADEIERLHDLHLERTKLTTQMISERDVALEKEALATTENARLTMMLDEYVRLDNAGKIHLEPVGGAVSGSPKPSKAEEIAEMLQEKGRPLPSVDDSSQWGKKSMKKHWCANHSWYEDRPCIHCAATDQSQKL